MFLIAFFRLFIPKSIVSIDTHSLSIFSAYYSMKKNTLETLFMSAFCVRSEDRKFINDSKDFVLSGKARFKRNQKVFK